MDIFLGQTCSERKFIGYFLVLLTPHANSMHKQKKFLTYSLLIFFALTFVGMVVANHSNNLSKVKTQPTSKFGSNIESCGMYVTTCNTKKIHKINHLL